MKFLVDAHLPRRLCAMLAQHGHEARRTQDLPMGNTTKDRIINQLSFDEQRVVVSKDTDFFYSHLLQARPGSHSWLRRETARARLEGFVRAQPAGD